MSVVHVEEINPANSRGYVTCDCCSESILNDMTDNIPDRIMYYLEPDGLYVCEKCLPELEDSSDAPGSRTATEGAQ